MTLRARMWSLLLALTLAWLTACSCPTVARNAVFVTSKDARTNAAVCDARVFVEEGRFRAELPALGCSYSGPTERPGTYVIKIEHAAHRAKTVSGIEVDEDSCGSVEPQQIEVLVDPL